MAHARALPLFRKKEDVSWHLKEWTSPVGFFKKVLAFPRQLWLSGRGHRAAAVAGTGPDAAAVVVAKALRGNGNGAKGIGSWGRGGQGS